MHRVRLALAVLISILPLSTLRVLAYRLLLGYEILPGTRIGFGTVIAVSQARLHACKIGRFNLFIGPMHVFIGEGASIGNANIFACGYWTLQEKYRHAGYRRRIHIGDNALITSGHYFDGVGEFVLGEGSWVAGVGSQFWTHGAGVTDRDVHIGRECYLGSAVRFAPGATVGNRVLVAMGSVVAGKIDVNKALIGGVPASVLREEYDWIQRGRAR
ncbi:MAG: hypothetical protein D6770_05390 [Anaerolineae bacterium]|nr:MAG: hypothetical protein D6770_05390 [Anaerolineae bacterium]